MVLLVFLTLQKVKIIMAIIFGYEKMVTTHVRMGIMQLKNCEWAYGERAQTEWYSKSIWWESTYVMAMFRCLALPCWALDDSWLPLELIVRIDFTLFVLSTKKFLFSGSIVCGNKDGIYQEIFLLCTIKWWLCAGSSALDRIWTSLHSLLAPYSYLGVGTLTTGVCSWCMATSI